MINISNKKFWNIMKGIGIFSIVIGHSCYFLVPFVYLFHLTVFFFLGGYFYNEDKYGEDPYKLLVSKLKANWSKYVIYSIIFILLHNILYKLGIIINTKAYHVSDIVTAISNTSLFFGTETLAGALWFVPVYICSSVIFGSIVTISKKFKKKDYVIILLSFFMGMLGCYLIYRNIYLMLHIQTSFLVIPFFMIGYFTSRNIKDLRRYLNPLLGIICFIILIYISFKTNYRINLTDNITGNFIFFYIVSFVGIYFCLFLSSIINNITFTKKIFNLVGIYSFEIMAFHFLVIKIIDFVYSVPKIMNGRISSEIYGIFPYAYKCLWPLYIILGTIIPVIVFYTIDLIKKDKLKNNIIILKLNNNKKIIYLLLSLLVICVGIPILRLGIMHNDELMSRFWSSQGFLAFYKHYFIEQIEKGRALSSFIIPATMYLGFIGQSSISFKLIQYLSILLCLLSMDRLLYKIFKDKKIIYVYSIIFLSFIQISFEPTVPNVFVTFYNVSICGILYSFSLYWDYLNNNKMKYLIGSVLIFFVVELTYESFITFLPIYILLYIYKRGFKNIFSNIKDILIPISAGILYLMLYVLSSKLFPSNYSGNQIGNISIANSLRIILNLGYYSFPASYLTSDKYLYLLKYHLNFNLIDIIRLSVFFVLFLIILILVLPNKQSKNNINNYSVLLKTLFAGLCIIILPILPISIASMYQNMDIGGITLGLPVSFFSYFGSVLIITIVSVFVSNKSRYGKIIIIIMLVSSSLGVQLMNNIFSREASKDFNRIQDIEKFIDSGLFSNFSGQNIYSTDMFITKHTLYVHDSHWNDFAKYHKINVNFINKEGIDNDIRVYFLDEYKIFKLVYNNDIYLISEKNLFNDYSSCIIESDDFFLKSNWNLYKLNSNNLNCSIFIDSY